MIFLYPTLSHFSTCFYYRHTVYLNLIFFTNTSITYIFILSLLTFFFFFFFNDTATTEIYTLSLHDALPICVHHIRRVRAQHRRDALDHFGAAADERQQRARVRGFAAAAHRRVDDVHACTRSEEHTSELQSLTNLVCRLLLEKKKSRINASRL